MAIDISEQTHGFDMTQFIFEVGVSQHLNALSKSIEAADVQKTIELLQTQAEVFIGIAQSLDLPGFGAIAQTTLAALEQNPHQVWAIAPIALANYAAARAAILAGDHEQGGAPSVALQQFCTLSRQPTVFPAGLILPLSTSKNFVAYTDSDDEPAELALVDLIPTDLASMNLSPGLLPNQRSHPSSSVAKTV